LEALTKLAQHLEAGSAGWHGGQFGGWVMEWIDLGLNRYRRDIHLETILENLSFCYL
jgi:hypothetical protein